MNKKWICFIVLWMSCLSVSQAREPIEKKVQVGNLEREYLVYPAVGAKKSGSVPLVFCFHGHGGGAAQASRSFQMHQEWPAALVVYPQGLPTPGRLTDPEGKRNGWQSKQGELDDRDLKFFDEMLKELTASYQVDAKQVYVMGHSNGGGFTYLLWGYRGDKIAAVAPCAALSLPVIGEIKSKPCLHIAATNDPLVKYEWQERMMKAVKRVNGCQEEGEKWAEDCVIYKPKDAATGSPMVEYIQDGAHKYPDRATELMVKFFKEVGAK